MVLRKIVLTTPHPDKYLRFLKVFENQFFKNLSNLPCLESRAPCFASHFISWLVGVFVWWHPTEHVVHDDNVKMTFGRLENSRVGNFFCFPRMCCKVISSPSPSLCTTLNNFAGPDCGCNEVTFKRLSVGKNMFS